LEHLQEDQIVAEQKEPELYKLKELSDRLHKDQYENNARLRKIFRVRPSRSLLMQLFFSRSPLSESLTFLTFSFLIRPFSFLLFLILFLFFSWLSHFYIFFFFFQHLSHFVVLIVQEEKKVLEEEDKKNKARGIFIPLLPESEEDKQLAQNVQFSTKTITPATYLHQQKKLIHSSSIFNRENTTKKLLEKTLSRGVDLKLLVKKQNKDKLLFGSHPKPHVDFKLRTIIKPKPKLTTSLSSSDSSSLSISTTSTSTTSTSTTSTSTVSLFDSTDDNITLVNPSKSFDEHTNKNITNQIHQ
jgi:hypothetical protein